MQDQHLLDTVGDLVLSSDNPLDFPTKKWSLLTSF